MLDDWSGIDVERAKAFVVACRVGLTHALLGYLPHLHVNFAFDRRMRVVMAKHPFAKPKVCELGPNILGQSRTPSLTWSYL